MPALIALVYATSHMAHAEPKQRRATPASPWHLAAPFAVRCGTQLLHTCNSRDISTAADVALLNMFALQDAVVHSMRFWGAYQRHGERAILHGRGNIAVAPTWLEATTLRNLFWASSLFDHLLKRYHSNLLSVLTSQLDASRRRAGEDGQLLRLLSAVPFAGVAMQEAAAALGTSVPAALAQAVEAPPP